MTRRSLHRPGFAKLPLLLRPLFWDHDFARLSWRGDRELIVGRILTAGDWQAVRWLRRRLGKAALRAWLERRRGGGLSPRQLRFWEIVLDLPRRDVNAWLAAAGRLAWDERLRP